MGIRGLQKMTLLDWPGRVACTVFLEGCDFRCPYCHNSQLLERDDEPEVSREELIAFLEKRRGLLDGVCVTGGEPLLWPALPGLLEEIKGLGYPVKLDTNGAHPRQLRDLTKRGLIDYVAMDIKNSPAKYPETVKVPGFHLEPVRESVSWLLEDHVDYEFRTTLTRQLHREEDMEEIGRWIAGAKRYYLQNFVLRDTVPDQSLRSLSREELERCAFVLRRWVKEVKIRGES